MVNDSHVDRWTESKRRGQLNSSFKEIKLCENIFDDKGQEANGLVDYRGKPRSSRSGPEIRFINPAIYAESIEGENEKEFQVCIRLVHKGDNSTDVKNACDSRIIEAPCCDGVTSTINLSPPIPDTPDFLEADRANNPETYRCCSSSTSTLTSRSRSRSSTSYTSEPLTSRSKPMGTREQNVRVEHRCRIDDEESGGVSSGVGKSSQSEVHRYIVKGHRVVKLSTSSLSLSEEPEVGRKLAYEEWVRKKRLDAQRKKEEEERAQSKKRLEEERLAREKEEKERRERESFLKWAERKNREEEIKKAVREKELELEERLKQVEDKAALAKTMHLRQWARNKEQQYQEQLRKQQLKQKQMDKDREKRLEESAKAYEKWREKSKNRPRPATQGLLPHQKAKPSYVNPLPWQSIINEDSQLEQPNFINDERSSLTYQQDYEKKAILSL